MSNETNNRDLVVDGKDAEKSLHAHDRAFWVQIAEMVVEADLMMRHASIWPWIPEPEEYNWDYHFDGTAGYKIFHKIEEDEMRRCLSSQSEFFPVIILIATLDSVNSSTAARQAVGPSTQYDELLYRENVYIYFDEALWMATEMIQGDQRIWKDASKEARQIMRAIEQKEQEYEG